MDPIEYIVLGLIYEAALDAACAVDVDDAMDRFIRENRREVLRELEHTPAPHGWRAQLSSSTPYRTWSIS